MKKLGLLIKVYLLQNLPFNRALHSRDKREKVKLAGFSALMAFTAIAMLFLMGLYAYVLAGTLEPMGALRVLPGAMMVVNSLILFFTTIYKAGSLLFGSRDADQLLSLPVGTKTVLAIRMILLYGMNLFFSLFIMVPAGAVYAMTARPDAWFYGYFVLTFLTMPLIPIVAASVIGLLLSLLASRFRHKNAVTLILSIALLCGVFALSFGSTNMTATDLTNMSTALTASIERAYPPSAWYIAAVADGSVRSLALFVLVSLTVFALFCGIVGWKYRAIRSALSGVGSNPRYRLTSLRTSSAFKALFLKELRRFLSSPLYVMNTIIGPVLLTLAAVVALVTGVDGLEKLLAIPELSEMIRDILPFGMALFMGMSTMSACTISLEGRQLWIPKTLPVSVGQIYRSKVALTLATCLPFAVIDGVLFGILLRLDILSMLLTILIPSAYTLLVALGGLLLNLLFPNFGWINEITVIKQSMPVLFTLLGGMASAAIPLAVVMLVPGVDAKLVALVTLAAVLAVCVLLYRVLLGWGVSAWKKLGG